MCGDRVTENFKVGERKISAGEGPSYIQTPTPNLLLMAGFQITLPRRPYKIFIRMQGRVEEPITVGPKNVRCRQAQAVRLARPDCFKHWRKRQSERSVLVERTHPIFKE